jgi:hypothetical protein
MYEQTAFRRSIVQSLAANVLALSSCATLPLASTAPPTAVALKKLSLRQLMDIEVTSVSRARRSCHRRPHPFR